MDNGQWTMDNCYLEVIANLYKFINIISSAIVSEFCRELK